MSHPTPPDVLALHAVRTLGYADTQRVADRLGTSADQVHEHLEDARARGWVTVAAFGGSAGWSLTDAGKAHGEALLAAELDAVGARACVEEVYRAFLPVNEVVSRACTEWQLHELGIDGAQVTLAGTLASLDAAVEELADLERRLCTHLNRFAGYHGRFTRAARAARTDQAWLTGTDRDSCHTVWFELHEDLLATLGLAR